MKVEEVQKQITTRITVLEGQEVRLRQWLECIRQTGEIAARIGCDQPGNYVGEASLMRAFKEIAEQTDDEGTPPTELEQLEPVKSAQRARDEGPIDQVDAGTLEPQAMESEQSDPVARVPNQESAEEQNTSSQFPDETGLDQLRHDLNSSSIYGKPVKKRLSAFMSSLLAPHED